MKFTDLKKREWSASITFGALKRIRSELGLDLLSDDGKALMTLSDDVEAQVNLLFVLVKDQASELGVSDVQFGEAMSGDVIAQAMDDFTSEYVDFFPNPIRRKVLRKALDKMRALQDRAATTLMDKMDGPEVEQAMVKALDLAGVSFTESLDTLASTPTPSPPAN